MASENGGEEMTTLCTGADSIAKAVGLKRRQVYALAEKGRAPIRNEPGIGLVADVELLKAYFRGKHQENHVPEEKR